MGAAVATISAIIVAAGRGSRLGAALPKAYVSVHGKPLIVYSLELLERLCSESIVVIHPDDEQLFQSLIERPVRRVHGGPHRQDSVLAGVRAASGEYVLVHDASRPCASRSLVERVISAMREHGAAVPVIPITDSVKRIRDNQIISDEDRSQLFCAQTPQGFRRALLLEALERACALGRYFTDEASCVFAMSGVRPAIVPGEASNIKVTTPFDLQLAQCLLTSQRAA
jgi:2-C-methyl-D-erythritol 4-phosphate cytidylyltransferase